MSSYGQQPPPYGPNPYGAQPYGQPAQPYGQPQPPYGSPPNPYAPPQPGQAPGQPTGYPAQPGYPGQGQWPGQSPTANQPVPVGRPAVAQRSIPVMTLETFPGRAVNGVLGEVVGVVARSRELPRELRTPNPMDGYCSMLTRSRQDAVERMVEMAVAAGADAVLGLRFDCSEITQSLSEVSAYGTAVTLSPVAGDAAGAPAGASTDEGAPGDPPEQAGVEPLTPPDFVGPPDYDQGQGADTAGSVPATGEGDERSSAHPRAAEGTQQPPPSAPGATPAPGQPWPPTPGS